MDKLRSLGDLRMWICYQISRRLMKPPMRRNEDMDAYGEWRQKSLSNSWNQFSDVHIGGKDVIDFGCGDGQLASYLALAKHPNRVLGIDTNQEAIERAQQRKPALAIPAEVDLEFLTSDIDNIPIDDESYDTLVAFDCMEHVMEPGAILKHWYRILRPGGRCLVEWFPFKGPWGPHMEALIPIPWAHFLFGERAMFRTAEMIYDLAEFTPRHWDLDDNGAKKPNKWRAWSSFEDQGYINKLDLNGFKRLAEAAGFTIDRIERHSFSGPKWRRSLGAILMNTPVIGEFFLSFVLVELAKR